MIVKNMSYLPHIHVVMGNRNTKFVLCQAKGFNENKHYFCFYIQVELIMSLWAVRLENQ